MSKRISASTTSFDAYDVMTGISLPAWVKGCILGCTVSRSTKGTAIFLHYSPLAMSRRSNQKRNDLRKKKCKSKGTPKNTPGRRRATVERSAIPSAQTMVRVMQLNFETREVLSQAALNRAPTLRERDAENIRQIECAPGLNEVLDLTSKAIGFAETTWFKRVRGFGPSAAPVIAQWFRAYVLAHPNDDYTGEEEKCIAALRWCEEAGVEHLLSCWDTFDDYGRSLVCVMLGLLDARHSADRIWNFYQQSKNNTEENLFIGALWGLIDLADRRTADALLELLMEGRNFYEIFGFLSRAGDSRTVVPLIFLSMKGDEGVREDAMWAVTSVGHRIGRNALIDAVNFSEPVDSELAKRNAVADRILSSSEEDAKKYFSLFYESDMSSSAEAILSSPLLH